MKKKTTLKLTCSAVCLALAIVLPFLTGQIQQFGNALCPMHIAVFLCGFLCGWPYGMAVGFIAPLLRFFITGMPVLFPIGIAMAFELAAYGFLSGFFYKVFPKKAGYIYLTLIISMLGGRMVWGAAQLVMARLAETSFPFSAFVAGAFTNAVPGIILQIIFLPLIIIALKKAKLILND